MLRQQAKLFTRLSMLADVLALVMALALAYLLRSRIDGALLPFQSYVWILAVVVPVWSFLLFRQELYASIRRLSVFEIITRLANVHLAGGVCGAAVIYYLDRDLYSRGLYLLFVLCSFLLLILVKVGLRKGLGYARRRGFNVRHLLIVGTGEPARNFYHLLQDHADWGLKVRGFVQVGDGPLQGEVEGVRTLGHAGRLDSICKESPVDEVVFCLAKDQMFEVEDHLKKLEVLGITVRMVLDFYAVSHVRKEISFFHETLPILTYHSKAFDSQQLLLKRLLDIAGAAAGLFMLVFMLPFVALAIKLDAPGPIFFGQKRMGEGGRNFTCWKFRSMYVDAEERKKGLLAQNEMSGAIFKIKDDPRITRVGHFLRKTSLDEFPQFWNVLRGEMSLVGTRPPTPDEVEQYENWQRRRISIKPGITGMWQVNGRNRIDDFDQIVELDLQYIDNWNVWLDLKILAKTVYVVFAREGSC